MYHEKAIELRKKGLSYSEIRKEIPVAKSSLSLWLKNIPLSAEHRRRLYTKRVELLARGPNSQRERRKRELDKIIQGAREEIKLPISDEAFRLMGAALYWAEGSKYGKFELTNSDPKLVLFMVEWMERTFGVPRYTYRAGLNIYPQQNEKRVKAFWSQLTGIPTQNFQKTYVKPPSKGYKKNNLYYGTIKVLLPKGTDNRHRVFGWIAKVLSEVQTKVEITEKRWSSLKKTARPVNLLRN